MIIGIDITMLVYAGSGVANYTFNLVKNLLLIDKKNKYRLFYSSLRRPRNFYYLEELKKLGGKVYQFPFPPTLLRLIWGKLNIIPIEWFTGKCNIFFFSDFLRPPLLPETRGVTTIHDLTWKLFPEFHTQEVISAHEKKLEKTIKYGDTIICDSQNTKKDLLKLYPQIDEKKVHVIYPGVGEKFKKINDNNKIRSVLKKYQVDYPTNFLFYSGAIEPRKNLALSIEVFNELIKNSKYSDYNFIIAGRAGWKNEQVFQLVRDLSLENKIKFVGYIEDEDLPYFYNACQLNIYLSSYEGFGLPPLEALACGARIIVGDNSSLKETIDEKYRVNLSDKKAIVEKIKKILSQYSPKPERKFEWENYTNNFFATFKKN